MCSVVMLLALTGGELAPSCWPPSGGYCGFYGGGGYSVWCGDYVVGGYDGGMSYPVLPADGTMQYAQPPVGPPGGGTMQYAQPPDGGKPPRIQEQDIGGGGKKGNRIEEKDIDGGSKKGDRIEEKDRDGGKKKQGSDGASAAPAPALIVVSLPADAVLTVDGKPTTSTSSTRAFISTPLNPSRTFTYTLKAEVNREGQQVTRSKEVTVAAGKVTRVVFDFGKVDVARK